MRCFKLLLMGGIVLALSTQAGAITFLQPYQGPVTMKFIDWDVGTLYGIADPANPVQGEANLDALNPQWPPPNSFCAEDMWGAAQLTTIRGQNNELLWSAAIPGTPEITGLFFGERDTYFDQSTTGGNITQYIHGQGVRIAFWEDANNDLGNPPGTYPGGNTGTARRTAEAVFEGATEGTLLWTLNSGPGWDVTYPNDEFFTTYSPSGGILPGGFNALGGMMADVGTIYTCGPDGAPGQVNVDDDLDGITDNLSELGFAGSDDVPMTGTNNWLFCGTPDDGVADWRIGFTGKPDSSLEFMVISDDPIDTCVVPEPVTMAGLLLGIGCLGRYVRRRR